MLAVSKALYSVLVQAPDLPAALLAIAEGLKNRIGSPETAKKAIEVAQVLEHCDPDRSRALAAYVIAWKSDPGRLDALSRARHLGRELGDFATSAKLAHLQNRHAPDSALLVFEGNAWLDAGDPDRAIKPLLSAVRAMPGDERVTLALATAQREWSDVRGQIDSLRAKAAALFHPAEAAELLLQAARMLTMLQTNDREVEACLLDAFDRDPENLSALGLLEGRLDTLVGEDRFMQICERRIAARQSPAAMAEELRRAGTRMAGSPRFRGLGIRLLERCLDYAYDAKLDMIPGHVASLSLLGQHARSSKLHSEFLELIDRGLSVPLSEIDHSVMATQALDIAWRHSVDEQAARTYAGIAASLAPRHPVVIEAREAGLDQDLFDASEAEVAPVYNLAEDDGDRATMPVVAFEDSRPHRRLPSELELDDATRVSSAPRIDVDAVDLAEVGTSAGEADDDDDGLLLLEDDEMTLISEVVADEVARPPSPPSPPSLPPPPRPSELTLPQSQPPDIRHTAPMPVVDFPPPAPVLTPVEESTPAPPPAPDRAGQVPSRSVYAQRSGEVTSLSEGKAHKVEKTRAASVPSLIPSTAIAALKLATRARKAAQAGPVERPFRLVLALSCEILGSSGRTPASIRDISIGGIFLLTASAFSVGQSMDLEIALPREKGMMQTDKFLTRIRIARHEPDAGYGAAFIAPAPALLRRVQALIDEHKA